MNEEYTYMDQETGQNKKRPVLLTVLCILSFIMIGISLLGLLFSLMGGQPTNEEIEATYNMSIQAASDMRDRQVIWLADMLEQAAELASYQQHRYWLVLLVNGVTMITGFIGALFMFRGRKLGFHLYIIYNLMAIGGGFLIAPAHMIPMASVIMNLVLSGLFIFLYSLNLKWMNK